MLASTSAHASVNTTELTVIHRSQLKLNAVRLLRDAGKLFWAISMFKEP